MSRKARKISLFIVALLVVVSVAGCSRQTSGEGAVYLPDDSLEKIIAKGKLVVGTAPGYFPFEMINEENEIIGYDIDIAKYLAEGLGVELEIVDYDWQGLQPALMTDKIDLLMSGMTILAERAAKVNFSVPYFETGQSIMVHKNTKGITNWKDLDKEGITIALIMGSSGAIAAERLFEQAELKEYVGATEAGLAVTTGKVNALFYDQSWIAVWTAKNMDSVYAVLDVVTKEKLGIAIKKGNQELLNYVNASITALRGTTTYEDMFNNWFVDMDWMDEVEVK